MFTTRVIHKLYLKTCKRLHVGSSCHAVRVILLTVVREAIIRLLQPGLVFRAHTRCSWQRLPRDPRLHLDYVLVVTFNARAWYALKVAGKGLSSGEAPFYEGA